MSPSIRVRSLGLDRRVSLVADTSLVSTSLGHRSRPCVARLGASHEAVRRCVRRIMTGPIIFTIVLALAQIGDAEAELLPFQSSAVKQACAQRTGFVFGPFGPKCRRGSRGLFKPVQLPSSIVLRAFLVKPREAPDRLAARRIASVWPLPKPPCVLRRSDCRRGLPLRMHMPCEMPRSR
jgi:hypothetical protein